jgi:cation:H+ antiporter
MILINLGLFLLFLIILIKCAGYSIRYSSRIARAFHLPEFIVSFFIVAIISVLPEATISIVSALNGAPELGLGTLLGSNVGDLTLVFGIVALFSSGGIKVKSKILNDKFFYLILLLFPLILGLDGMYSRIDGAILVLVGALFFVRIYRESKKFKKKFVHKDEENEHTLKNFILLILSLIILAVSAFLTVRYAVNFANEAKIPEILVGIAILALGTCLPELIFSIRAVRKNHDELALGDILGTVITDATIILGIVALISPFSYALYNIYILGGAMFLAGLFAIIFMRSDKSINKTEGVILILFYILFLVVEFFANNFVNLK